MDIPPSDKVPKPRVGEIVCSQGQNLGTDTYRRVMQWCKWNGVWKRDDILFLVVVLGENLDSGYSSSHFGEYMDFI